MANKRGLQASEKEKDPREEKQRERERLTTTMHTLRTFKSKWTGTRQGVRVLSWSMVLALSGLLLTQGLTYGESLFHASASFSEDAPMTPRALFTQPRPKYVGDIVTILVDESPMQQVNLQMRINKNHQLNENGSTLFNNMIRFYVDKIPFLRGKGQRYTDIAPNFNGMSNQNDLQTQVQNMKTTRYRDNITCQVVQVLPNGHLLVQGRKATMFSKERTDLFVTGIVNPYYLDNNNTINSRQVANMQFMMSGKGTISRQQNDSLPSKIYQFFN